MSRYLCLCDQDADPQTKLPRHGGASNLHLPPDLYFCPRCHTLKCTHCCTVEVECKYCPSCMSDYSDSPGLTRCTKNCFQCPECRSPLDIDIQNLEVDHCKGKKFSFSCVHCNYRYHTRFISKPASLTTILKQERPLYFAQLHAKYSIRHRLHAGLTDPKSAPGQGSDSAHSRASLPMTPEVLSKMQQLNVNPEHIMDERDSLIYRMAQIETHPVDIDRDFRPPSEPKLPLGNHLYAKNSRACNICATKLCVPIADPRLMKYLTKEVAPDIVPAVTVKRRKDKTGGSKIGPDSGLVSADPHDPELAAEEPNSVSCILSVVNPLLDSMNVTVSTLGQDSPNSAALVPLQTSTSCSLPVTSFTIGPRQEKAKVLDAVPSVYLTDATPQSRAEKLTRTIRNELKSGSLEKGFNWVSVPLNVLACRAPSEVLMPLTVCVYVTVETRAPSAWVASGKSKKSLKYGFWAVCEVED